MSNILSSLQVILGADTAAFQQDLRRASESANDNFGKIADAAKTMAEALGVAFTVDYIKDNIKKAIDYADAMSDLAGKTGIATEELTAMEYALHFSDATLENYTDGLQKLTVNMVSSVEGNKDLADTFKKLKVDIEDGNHKVRQSKDVFLDAAEAISKMKDGAVKTDLAMKLFGKSAGPELIPFLNQGKEGIKELTDEAQKMGAVVSTEMAEQSAQFNDNMAKMGYAAKGAWNVIAQQLTPSLNGMATSMVKGASDGKVLEATAKGIGIAFHAAFTVISFVVTETEFFGDAIGKVAAVVSTFASDGAAAAKAVWNDQTGNIKATEQLKALAAGWTKAGQAATESAKVQTTAADTTGGKALGGNGKTKDKKIKPAKEAKDNFDYGIGGKNFSEGSVSAREYNNATTGETLSNSTYVEPDLMPEVLADYELRFDAEKAYQDKVKALRDKARAQEKTAINNGVNVFMSSLNAMASHSSKAAKAAELAHKLQAVAQVRIQTRTAASGAAAAVAWIPGAGPALAAAYRAAMYVLGAADIAAIMSGGGSNSAPSMPSVSSSTPNSTGTTGSNEIVPISQQQNQTTYIRIPEDRMMTGRQLIDFIDEALGDGKQFNNFRFIPA